MFRATLLAIAATAGLVGTTEFGGSNADAHPPVRVVVGFNGFRPIYHRPIIVGGPVIYAPPTVVVAPVCPTYNVFYRCSPAEAWRVYGTFTSPVQATQTVNSLAQQGFIAYQGVN
jgi:hypothetical protein